ncbi:MAG: rhodanese-like domain-containing protein [Pseudomonadota bacterium]
MTKAESVHLPEIQHTAFYKFVTLDHPGEVAVALREHASDLLGSILVAGEGINGMLAGAPAHIAQFETTLASASFAAGKFADIVFKHSLCKTVPFRKLKIHVKAEIVPLGIEGVDATKTGINLSPAAWREFIVEDDVVLLDNRNSFEFRLGRFKNAIDPQVTNFRDFPNYVKAHLDEWKRDGKRVAMYCTGGIRCEKTSAWMQDMDIPVYQLEGGILNYFKEMPDAEHDWQGECFVFDNRIALDTKLEETDTTLDDVYGAEPDGEWRLARAKRLDEAA